MKKLVSLCLSFVVALGMFPSMAFAANKTAAPTNSQVLVNGKNVAFDAYTIDGNNYFKLRDLAFALNGSIKQFEVAWDGGKNAINLIPAKAYTVASGELQKGDGKSKNAVLSTATTYINGNKASLTAYTINGNNYFKLRDIMQYMDIYVGWDGAKNSITLDTSSGYAVTEPSKPATGQVITVPVTIVNETGVDLYTLAMSPDNDDMWSENLLTSPLLEMESGVTEMSFTADTLVWDLLVEDIDGNELTFMGLDFSDVDVAGAKLLLSSQDGSYYAMFVNY